MAAGLEDIRVVETASAVAGAMAGRLLASWGADVIKVEHTMRVAQTAQRRASELRGTWTTLANVDYGAQNNDRNKRSITLNLSMDSGREIIYKLLQKSDVLLSNFRPRELEKFKLEYETLSQLNPRLICANITAYGSKGPERNAAGYGQIAGDARSGLLYSLTAPGMPPPQTTAGVTDLITGISVACGIMTALFIRERTGVGQGVDASLFNSMFFVLSNDITAALVTGKSRQTVERKAAARPLSNTYQTKDGRWLILSVMGIMGAPPDIYWPRFCRAIEREDLAHDPRFNPLERILENHLALFNILEETFLTKTLDEWKPRLNEGGFPWSPLQNSVEAINDPQARANDFLIPLDHPTYGHIKVVANPIRLSKTPETIRMPAPEPGKHTEEVLLEYGYTAEDIAQFKEQGVVA